MLAAIEAGVTVVEYTPAEIKRAVVGYGRAEKPQVAQMVKLLLGLDAIPKPHDATDALAVAICHLHSGMSASGGRSGQARKPADAAAPEPAQSRRDYRPHDCAALRQDRSKSIRIELIVDVSGVGYDVQVPLSTFYVCGDRRRARSRCAFTPTCARINSRCMASRPSSS